MVASLPDDVPSLVRIVQGLLTYDVMTERFHGFQLSDDRQHDIHIRSVEDMISRMLEFDARALDEPRAPRNRLAGRCGHYARLLVSMLRVKGIPARMRGGFATYFDPDSLEDHYVCEYWDGARWVMADPQLDKQWLALLRFEGDPLDLTPDQFLNAGVVWQGIRTGAIDPDKVGIDFANLRGAWFAGGSVIRDLAALNKVELLPWDTWGAQPKPGGVINGELNALLDRIAALTANVPDDISDIRSLYEGDLRVRVPASIFNAITLREERLAGGDGRLT